MVLLAIGVHELAAMSERRIERLVNPAYSELPAFLVGEGGLNSGFMIAHCTAAALGKFLVNTGCPLPGVALAGQGHALIKTHETWTLHKYFIISDMRLVTSGVGSQVREMLLLSRWRWSTTAPPSGCPGRYGNHQMVSINASYSSSLLRYFLN